MPFSPPELIELGRPIATSIGEREILVSSQVSFLIEIWVQHFHDAEPIWLGRSAKKDEEAIDSSSGRTDI